MTALFFRPSASGSPGPGELPFRSVEALTPVPAPAPAPAERADADNRDGGGRP